MKTLAALLLLFWCASAWAAPTIGANCTSLKKETGGVTSSSDSLASTPAIGSKIHFFFFESNLSGITAGASTFTDNQSGNTYAIPSGGSKQATNNQQKITFADGTVVGSTGTFTLTVHSFSTQSNKMVWMACEETGLATSSWFDKVGTTEVLTGTSLTVTAGGANGQASELVLTCIWDGAGTNAASGYTVLLADTTLFGGWCGYKVVSSIENSAASWTFSSNPASIAVLITNKAAPITIVQRRTPNCPRTGSRCTQ